MDWRWVVVRAFEKTNSSPKFPATEFVAVAPRPLTYNVPVSVAGTEDIVTVLEALEVPFLYTVVTVELPDVFTASIRFQEFERVRLELPTEVLVAITS
jgi:hypothetical protein